MPFADELLGPEVAVRLAGVLEGARPGHPFDAVRASGARFEGLSLRQRTDLLSAALLDDVPGGAAALESVFRRARENPGFTGWMIWPVTEAVVSRALEEGGDESFDAALALLADLTGRLTSEFAIRGLLRANLARALPVILGWTTSDDEHVRRLASEGTRAFLPWATRVPALLAAPESTVPIISALYRDESEYVRRSVANHLNDLSRQNPELVTRVAGGWMLEPDAHTLRVVTHGLRTLVKKGHPGALGLFGFEAGHGVTVVGPTLVPDVAGPPAAEAKVGSAVGGPPGEVATAREVGPTSVAIGAELPFSVTLSNTSSEPHQLVVDYMVHHRKANGALTTKVFKLATVTVQPGQSVTYDRRHSFALITTRRYHPGTHAIEVQVNGVASGRAEFELRA